MPADPQSSPLHAPPQPGRLLENFRAAIADPKARPGAHIRLRATGGVHGEGYDFDYVVDAAGNVSGHLRDELKGRHVERLTGDNQKQGPASFAALAEAIDIEALLRSETPRGGFPPDSVVGRFEISDGEQTETFLFLADEHQARRAALFAPDPLRKAIEAVWRAASAQMGSDDVRP